MTATHFFLYNSPYVYFFIVKNIYVLKVSLESLKFVDEEHNILKYKMLEIKKFYNVYFNYYCSQQNDFVHYLKSRGRSLEDHCFF